MTKHTCDACGKEMDAPVIMAIPGVIVRIGLMHSSVAAEFCVPAFVTPFYEARNMPIDMRCELDGVAICRECMLSAFKKAVAELK